MATAIDIGTLIVRTPEVREGRSRVAGTGIAVRRIVGWYKLSLNEIPVCFGQDLSISVQGRVSVHDPNVWTRLKGGRH